MCLREMGIKDLLRFMKPYTEVVHIEKYAGKRVGIDAYSWLHKGAYSCSMEICLDSDSDAKFKYIRYFLHRIDMLRHYNVVPVVVFDGGNVACKAATEDERYRRRQANRKLAMEKLKEGNVSAATELFQRAISITTSMAHQLIQTLRGENVEFMVAPYEADAQLAYLSNLGEEKGGIEAVITEDSDLLAYGCSSVIFKMDRYGNGEEILLEKVFNSTNCKPSFQNFNRDLFTGMCVLAGCDFLPSIPGIGIGKAYSLVSKYYNIDRVLSVLKFGKANQMPEDYLKSYRQAVAVFQHARVYDKITKKIQHIKPLDEELLHELDAELDFLGSDLPPSIATAISEGILDPMTMEAYNCSQNTIRHGRNPSFKQKKDATTIATTAGSCFAVYTCQKKNEAKISSAAQVPVQGQVLKERNYSNETAQLAKIVQEKELVGNSLDNSCRKRKQGSRLDENTSADSVLHDKSPVKKTPNNNPFKRCNQVTSDMSDISMVSVKTVMKKSQYNHPFRRCDQVTSAMSAISMLSDEEPQEKIGKQMTSGSFGLEGDNTFSDLVLDSQQSVNSKMEDKSKGNGCRRRLKNSDCKKLGGRTRRSTILDFFSHS